LVFWFIRYTPYLHSHFAVQMDLATEQATMRGSAQDNTVLRRQLEERARHWNSRYAQSLRLPEWAALGLPEWAASHYSLSLFNPEAAVYRTMSKANETLADLLRSAGKSVNSPSQNCSKLGGCVNSLNENGAYMKLYDLYGAWEHFAIDTAKVLSAVTNDESVDASGRDQIALCHSQLTDHVSHTPINNEPQSLNSC